MTTVVSTPPSNEITTPTSYVSRWIAQSHGGYQKKNDDFYSPTSSYDFRKSTVITFSPSSTTTFITTWQAQAKSRLDAAVANANIPSLSNANNNELQEKLSRIRAQLDAKKQRLCRQLSSASSSNIPLSLLSDQVPFTNTVGEQSSPPSILALENVYEESSSTSACGYNSCSHHHHHHHHQPSMLPCLMEESPSDSGFSDGTKTTIHEDGVDTGITTVNNPALVDLSKPLSKEEMLAIMQILKELWKRQFGTEIPNVEIKTIQPMPPPPPPPAPPAMIPSNSSPVRRVGGMSCLLNKNKTQYHSTPTLNKLSAELSDIKEKLTRFSTTRTSNETTSTTPQPQAAKSSESEVSSKTSQMDSDESPCCEDALFFSFNPSLTPHDLERMQEKKETLIRRQIQRREEQLMKKSERQATMIERQNEYRLFEDYLVQRRQEDESRRQTILQAHVEQKRLESDPPSSHDYYFAAARTRNRLKRKASTSSFLSFDEDVSFGGSTFDLFSKQMQTPPPQPRRSATRFDLMSPSLTAPTAASQSKMNRAVSTTNINGHYESLSSLNSKKTIPLTRTTRPAALFGGSLMNLSLINSKKSPQFCGQKRQPFNVVDDPFDLAAESSLSASLTSLATTTAGIRAARNQTLLTTKSNKQTILNSLKQVVLAGPANERQREIVSREVELSEARHFVLLFRDHRLQFRAIYVYIPETDIIEKLHGIGPNVITEIMVDKWYKYNSGGKRFTNIPIKHFSIQCDAVIIHNDFWQKKLLMHMNKEH